MVRRSARSDTSIDYPRLVAALTDCRRVFIETQARAKAGGPLYQGCSMVVAAIDGLTTFVTGNPYYHHPTGHSVLGAPWRPPCEGQDGA